MPEISPLDKIGEELSALWQDYLVVTPPASLAALWKDHILIREKLEEIAAIQKATKFTRPDRLEHLGAFLAWAKEVGIQSDGVEIGPAESDQGLGLRASAPLSVDSIAVVVPQSAVLSADYAEECHSLKAILENDEMIRAMPNIGLAIIIAHETLRGAESKWAPFLNVLPATFATPLFYTLDQIQALKPSQAFEESLNMFRMAARQFVYFYLRIISEKKTKKNNKRLKSDTHPFTSGPFAPENFTFELYRWCVSAVSTRINLLPSAVRKNADGSPIFIPTLIPFVDMANHEPKVKLEDDAPGPASIFFHDESKSVVFQLHRDVDKGEAVTANYGARTNMGFLLHNGFVPPLPNLDNKYDLKLGMPRSANSAEKVRRLNNTGIPDSQGIFVFHLDPAMLATHSFRNSALWEFAKTFVADDLSEIGTTENEEKARNFLCVRFQLLLRGYDKIADDEATVARDNDPLKTSVWRLHKSEQEILKTYLGIVEKEL